MTPLSSAKSFFLRSLVGSVPTRCLTYRRQSVMVAVTEVAFYQRARLPLHCLLSDSHPAVESSPAEPPKQHGHRDPSTMSPSPTSPRGK